MGLQNVVYCHSLFLFSLLKNKKKFQAGHRKIA